MPFALTHRELDANTVLVTLAGELELSSAPAFKRQLLELRRSGYSRFILDFSPLTFFDSTALSVLVVFNRDVSATGRLALAGLPPVMARVLNVTGVDRVFDLFPDVEAASSALRNTVPSGPEARLGPEPGVQTSITLDTGLPPSPPPPAAEEVQAPLTEAATGPLTEAAAAPLTEDAAVVLGIAATAIPFAGSPDAQAERWLRALSRSGDTGIALKVLGAHDDVPEGTADLPEAAVDSPEAGVRDQARVRADWTVDADVLATVTRQAGELAAHHHRAIQTDDLLVAVANVYGPVFDRVLARHGVAREELLDALASG